MLHHGLAACSVLTGKPVVQEAVDGQHVGSLNRFDVTFPHAVTDHHPDGIGLVGRTGSEKLQNGLGFRADYGPVLFLLLFLAYGILNRAILDTRLLVRQIVHVHL